MSFSDRPRDGWYQLVDEPHLYVEVYLGERKRYLNAGNRPGNFYGSIYTIPKDLPFYKDRLDYKQIEVGYVTATKAKVYAISSWMIDEADQHRKICPIMMIQDKEDYLKSTEKQKEDLILKTKNEETLIYELY